MHDYVFIAPAPFYSSPSHPYPYPLPLSSPPLPTQGTSLLKKAFGGGAANKHLAHVCEFAREKVLVDTPLPLTLVTPSPTLIRAGPQPQPPPNPSWTPAPTASPPY